MGFWEFGSGAHVGKVENARRLGHGWRDHCGYLSNDTDQRMRFSISPRSFFPAIPLRIPRKITRFHPKKFKTGSIWPYFGIRFTPRPRPGSHRPTGSYRGRCGPAPGKPFGRPRAKTQHEQPVDFDFRFGARPAAARDFYFFRFTEGGSSKKHCFENGLF